MNGRNAKDARSCLKFSVVEVTQAIWKSFVDLTALLLCVGLKVSQAIDNNEAKVYYAWSLSHDENMKSLYYVIHRWKSFFWDRGSWERGRKLNPQQPRMPGMMVWGKCSKWDKSKQGNSSRKDVQAVYC